MSTIGTPGWTAVPHSRQSSLQRDHKGKRELAITAHTDARWHCCLTLLNKRAIFSSRHVHLRNWGRKREYRDYALKIPKYFQVLKHMMKLEYHWQKGCKYDETWICGAARWIIIVQVKHLYLGLVSRIYPWCFYPTDNVLGLTKCILGVSNAQI